MQATFAATLVDEWVRGGVTHAVVCPGSRSTPLALALAERAGDLRLHVHHDERSGAFTALGTALATGRPAVVLTTSGTATAELHPAIVEADLAAVPLIACTADRPPELRDVGAPQAIDQVHLYGRAVRWFGDPGVPDPTGAARWRAFAARALAEATGSHPGPVHLNLPFREPLVGVARALPPGRDAEPWTAVVPGGTGTGVAAEPPPMAVEGNRRGVIVAGAAAVDGPAVHLLAAALRWPVLADPRSAAWCPDPSVVPHVDALIRATHAASLRPETIVRIGPPPASRVVNEWLAGSRADEIVLGVPGWSDPSATAHTVVRGDATSTVDAWAATVGTRPGSDPRHGRDAWLDGWRRAGTAAAEAVASTLAERTPANEPAIARDTVAALADGTSLLVSSSMPIRDVERYATPRTGLRVVANRGANGIDGVVSTAVGVALGSAGPTALLVGDIAFLHDVNGLLGAADRTMDLVCVVIDNDGGGIFSFLPQARALAGERFEALFGTPHGLDLVAVARAHGVAAHSVEGAQVVSAVSEAAARGGLHVLVVRTDRTANVDRHRQVDDAVAAAVDRVLA